jgi:HEAT repeat protein
VAAPGDGISSSEEEVAKRLQALSPQSIPAVMELLKDPDGNVRELAGYVLRDMPGLRPEHLGPLERAVEAGDDWLPPAIASIGTPDAIRFLVGELKKKPETHTQLTYAFERLGSAALPELLELFRCGTSCDESLLRVVAFIFSETRDGAAEAVDPLLSLAAEENGTLIARRAALRGLAALGATARPAVKALMEMTHRKPIELQTEARRTVLAIGGPGTREALESSLDDTEDQRLVLRDLAALGVGGREAGPRVEKLLSSSEPDVRVAAARTLGFIGYRTSTRSLVAALDDADDWRVVYTAADALGRLRAVEAREALQATASDHWYPPVRDAARTALRALDAKYRYVSSPNRTNFALDFFDYEHAGRAYSPCADQAHYPSVPQRPETLDPTGQPSLAEQLAYDREIRGLSEKGWQTTHRRTIPEVGLRVDGGWLVGGDHGEWGGELLLKPDGGPSTKILDKNIAGLHVIADGRIVAVTGLAHLGMDEGSLYTIACAPTKACSATRWKALPGAPRSSWLIATGELLVNTTGGSVLVAPDGALRLADCHAAIRPRERPGR